MLEKVKQLLTKQRDKRKFCTAIVAAAGTSSRMGGENKQLLPLGGIPVLIRTLQALDSAETVDAMVVATREEDIVTIAELVKTYGIGKPVTVVLGGANRVESVLLALQHAPRETTLFAVQDGARPFVTKEIIDNTVRKAAQCGAAAPAIPVKDTIKIAAEQKVISTPERKRLFAVQTPQVFDADLLKAALQSAVTDKAEITDDCSAVERLGKEIYLTEGSEENIKITTPLDKMIAEGILQWRETI
ncbi:MAG: 2-C-methyl-D-erythritol 4-phosphate cytidylyltransferase [Oscillospiraceae bacterium]|nr:2-C-methyl-D-erythritol 4-phosphate cytidylyltransferase [Oscillospiraceae bacterium]MBR6677801.1 2-C-methyl-D-erythritol 4-phosphate cytidylyltransferase [Oscillospiraceae bacterium]